MEPHFDAIATLRELLPWWAAWGSLGPILAAALVAGFLAPRLAVAAAAGPLRALPPDAPWYERARAAVPAQFVSGLGLVLPGAAFAMLARLTAGPLSATRSGTAFGLVMLAGSVGGIWTRWRFQRELHGDERSLGKALRADGFLLLLLLPQLIVVVAMGLALRAPFDALDALVVLAGTVGCGIAAWWGGLPLLRALGWAWPAPEPLQAAVAAVADRLGTRRPRVDVVAWPVANAFAFSLTQRLCLTEGILEALDPRELDAVVAHELGHLSESRGGRAVRFAAGFLLLPFGLVPMVVALYGARASRSQSCSSSPRCSASGISGAGWKSAPIGWRTATNRPRGCTHGRSSASTARISPPSCPVAGARRTRISTTGCSRPA